MSPRLTPEQVIHLRSVTDAQISPDGRRVAFTCGDMFKDDTPEPRSRVWVVPTDAPDPAAAARPLTAGPRSDHSPRWSPDGTRLSFLSDRLEAGKFQLWVLPMDGGEAANLLNLEGGSLSAPQWSPDGRRIAFLMDDRETDEEKRRREERDDVIEFEQHPRYRRLYTIDPVSGEYAAVTGELQVWDYAWSADGESLAAVVSDESYAWAWYRSRLATVAPGRAPETLLESRRQLARPLPSPDGRYVAYLSCTWSDAGVIGGDLWVLPAGGGTPRCLSEGRRTSVTWMEWDGPGQLFVCGHQGGEIALFSWPLEGAPSLLSREEATFAERSWPRYTRAGGTVAVAREDARRPRDVWIARPDVSGFEWRQLTRQHPELEELELAQTETVRWTAPDGLEIQGLLLRPVGDAGNGPWPLAVLVHGGPASLWPHRFQAGVSIWAQLLAARGIAVLLPNPRGSTGWGVEFTEANLGDMGGRDWEDILAGLDACIERGVADPTRLGLGGWSYGGFMTAWGVSQTDRFRVAVMGAGICNWRSFHGNTDIPTWDALFYRADPYERDGAFDRFSALSHADRIATPTLILHGEQDTCVPVGQAYEFFRCLQDRGVPTELAVYPREGHGIMEKKHQADVLRRVLAWYERHLLA